MGKAAVLTALFAVCCFGGVAAGDAVAAVGDLAQKAGPAGCISELGTAPCADGTALAGAFSVTVSPDGKNAYVASATSNAVAVFDRAADGTLTQKGCVSDTGAGPCVDATALAGAASVAVSPDGKNAYVASSASNAIAVFDRAADGTLTQKIGTAACISDAGIPPCVDGAALAQPISVTVSPDGKNAYVASSASDAIAVFDRAVDGTLTQKPGPAACIAETAAGGCTDGTGLDGARSVTVSPDGKNAYVASDAGDAVAALDRAADGTLTQKPGPARCIAETAAGGCTDGVALDGAASVTVGPDGKNAYVASATSNAVAAFDRGADGALTQKPGPAGCSSDAGAAPCADATALINASSVTVSPDGRSTYVASAGSSAVAAFDRAANGALTQKPGAAACIAETAAGGCTDASGAHQCLLGDGQPRRQERLRHIAREQRRGGVRSPDAVGVAATDGPRLRRRPRRRRRCRCRWRAAGARSRCSTCTAPGGASRCPGWRSRCCAAAVRASGPSSRGHARRPRRSRPTAASARRSRSRRETGERRSATRPRSPAGAAPRSSSYER